MAWTDEELLTVDPELAKIFKIHGIPKLPLPTRETLLAFRKKYATVTKRYNESSFAKSVLGSKFTDPDWTECDHHVPTRDGSTIKVRTYSPRTAPQDGVPCLVFIHGGGWYMGDLETEAFLCKVFCTTLGVCVVNVDYRLYPEVRFGVPVTDCHDAIKWISVHAESFGANLHKGFIVGGTSGGGTYASITVHLARDDGMCPPITGCYLTCPILADEVKGPNREPIFDRVTENRSIWQNKDAPLMTQAMRDSIEEFADFEWNSKLLTPFLFPSHTNMPATFVQVCGLDPWRDVGVLYERELRKSGSSTRLQMFPGLPHCFWTTFPQLKATQLWLKDTMEGLHWLLTFKSHVSTTRL